MEYSTTQYQYYKALELTRKGKLDGALVYLDFVAAQPDVSKRSQCALIKSDSIRASSNMRPALYLQSAEHLKPYPSYNEWQSPTDPASTKPVLAGFWERVIATYLDAILLHIFILAGTTFKKDSFGNYFEVDDISTVFFKVVLPLVVMIVCWMRFGCTPGKWVLGLSVIDEKTGKAPTLIQSLKRILGYAFSALPCFVGFISLASDTKKQGWHDIFSGTLVVRGWEPQTDSKPSDVH